MKEDERRIYFFDLEVATNKKSTVPPKMGRILEALIERYHQQKTLYTLRENTLFIDIKNIWHSSTHFILYLVASDRSAPNAAFSNPEKQTSRFFRKRSGEGRSFGGHVFISKDEIDGKPDTYLCVIEKNTNIHRTHVQAFLLSVFRSLYKEESRYFECDHTGGQRTRGGEPKQVNFRPMFQLGGHPSEDFITQLNDVILKTITLETIVEDQTFGDASWLKKTRRTLRVVVEKENAPVENKWNALMDALGTSAEAKTYETARIKFRNPASSKDDDVLVDVGARTLISDEMFLKSRAISKIKPPLEDTSEDGILAHLCDRVVPHLASELGIELDLSYQKEDREQKENKRAV